MHLSTLFQVKETLTFKTHSSAFICIEGIDGTKRIIALRGFKALDDLKGMKIMKALKTIMKSLKPLVTSKIYLFTLLNACQCFVQAFSFDLFHDQ